MQKPKHFISWTISNWQYPGRPPFPLCPWHRCQATGTEVLREIPGKLHGLFYVKDFCCVVAMDNSEGNIRKRADRVYLRATPPAGSMVILGWFDYGIRLRFCHISSSHNNKTLFFPSGSGSHFIVAEMVTINMSTGFFLSLMPLTLFSMSVEGITQKLDLKKMMEKEKLAALRLKKVDIGIITSKKDRGMWFI